MLSDIHSICFNSSFGLSQPTFPQHVQKYVSKIKTLKVTNIGDTAHLLLAGNYYDLVQEARSNLLKSGLVKSQVLVKLPLLDYTGLQDKLIELVQDLDVQVKLDLTFPPKVILCGPFDIMEIARTRILVYIDQLADLSAETVDGIPFYLQQVLAGRKHIQLHSIMEETSTNIYIQSPFNQLFEQEKPNTVCITGESKTDVSRARDLLIKLLSQKVDSMYHKEFLMDQHKLDWILLNKRDELKKIMRDNGSYFEFPVPGSETVSVVAYAENRVYAERSIRLLNHLTSDLYEAKFRLMNPDYMKATLEGILSEVSQSTGITAFFKAEELHLYLLGTADQLQNAYCLLYPKMLHGSCHSVTYSIELAADQREFVSGKKNGKINKIMKKFGVQIRFIKVNDYNSSVVLESKDLIKGQKGLFMLQDELPAEISFYVPEVYHRRIIGVGGKNIQKIMKKHGVYVKFSGAEEFTSLGGYFENEDNVIARTPMKNNTNLESLKHAITSLIGFPKDKNYVTQEICVPYMQHRLIQKNHNNQLRDICRLNHAKIEWPERTGCDQVMMYGPQTHLPLVAAFIQQHVVIEKHPVIDESLSDSILLNEEFNTSDETLLDFLDTIPSPTSTVPAVHPYDAPVGHPYDTTTGNVPFALYPVIGAKNIWARSPVEDVLSWSLIPKRNTSRSWPDIFLHGRDIFEALPSRRASDFNLFKTMKVDHLKNSAPLFREDKQHEASSYFSK